LKFTGCDGGSKGGEYGSKIYEIFKAMPHNNSKFIHTVYIKGEELFDKVINVKTEYVE